MRTITALLLAGSILASAGPALGQAALPPAPPASNAAAPTADPAPNGLEDIVVTAQRRAENLQRAALAVSAVSGDALINAGVTRPTELTTLVPSLQVVTSAGPYALFYLRGVGNFNGNALSDGAVAFNVDGVYIGRPSSTTGFFYDLQRIEVVKGPQGTLYGRNATGGAINVLTHRPDLGTFGGYANAEIGNYDSRRFEGAVNVPVGEMAALRFAGTYVKHDGYLNDGTDNQNEKGGRASLLVEPADNLKVSLSTDYFKQDGRGPGSVALAQGKSNRFGVSSPQGQAFYAAQPNAIGGRTLAPLPPIQSLDNSYWGAAATIDWTTPLGTVSLIPAHREAKLDILSTSPGFLIVQKEKDLQDSFEARLASDDDRPLRYLLGAFYYNERNKVPVNNINSQFNASFQSFTQKIESEAVFGRLTYALTDTLKITGGARYTNEARDFDLPLFTAINIICVRPTQFVPTYIPGCPNAQPVPNGQPTPFPPRAIPDATGTIITSASLAGSNSVKTDKITYHASVAWQLTPANLLYGSFETGFKSGGFFATNSDPTPLAPDPGIYRPETIQAYTIGSKNRFFGNKLQLNIEAFYWRYKDQQISHTLFSSKGTVIFATENVGRATFKGVEVETEYLLTENTRLSADLQYLDAKYNDFVYGRPNTNRGADNGTGCPNLAVSATLYSVDCSGFRPPNAPEWTINLGAQQTVPLANGAKVVLNGRTHYQSRTLTGLEFTAIEYQAGYWTADASLTYAAAEDRFYVTAFANNIGDRTIIGNSFPTPLTFFTVGSLRPPRTYGVRVGTRF